MTTVGVYSSQTANSGVYPNPPYVSSYYNTAFYIPQQSGYNLNDINANTINVSGTITAQNEIANAEQFNTEPTVTNVTAPASLQSNQLVTKSYADSIANVYYPIYFTYSMTVPSKSTDPSYLNTSCFINFRDNTMAKQVVFVSFYITANVGSTQTWYYYSLVQFSFNCNNGTYGSCNYYIVDGSNLIQDNTSGRIINFGISNVNKPLIVFNFNNFQTIAEGVNSSYWISNVGVAMKIEDSACHGNANVLAPFTQSSTATWAGQAYLSYTPYAVLF